MGPPLADTRDCRTHGGVGADDDEERRLQSQRRERPAMGGQAAANLLRAQVDNAHLRRRGDGEEAAAWGDGGAHRRPKWLPRCVPGTLGHGVRPAVGGLRRLRAAVVVGAWCEDVWRSGGAGFVCPGARDSERRPLDAASVARAPFRILSQREVAFGLLSPLGQVFFHFFVFGGPCELVGWGVGARASHPRPSPSSPSPCSPRLPLLLPTRDAVDAVALIWQLVRGTDAVTGVRFAGVLIYLTIWNFITHTIFFLLSLVASALLWRDLRDASSSWAQLERVELGGPTSGSSASRTSNFFTDEGSGLGRPGRVLSATTRALFEHRDRLHAVLLAVTSFVGIGYWTLLFPNSSTDQYKCVNDCC